MRREPSTPKPDVDGSNPFSYPRLVQPVLDRNCVQCHADKGQGLIGPNLTDDYWIHGSNFVDSLRVIWNGVPSKLP